MNSNYSILLLVVLLSLNVSITLGFADEYDYVVLRVNNYTLDSTELSNDGSCTEEIDFYLTTTCGSSSHDSKTKSSDSCSSILNDEYKYTSGNCDTDDYFNFVLTANNDCNGNFEALIIGSCAQDYTWVDFGNKYISDYECGWNGPNIAEASNNEVSYELYVPCPPTPAPTPSPTANSESMLLIICVADYTLAATDDADTIKVRLWTDDDDYKPTEWRNLTSSDSTSTLFSNAGECHTFHTFDDIYAQWYLLDLSICSTDGLGISRIMFWDKESESLESVSEFSGDGDCIKADGDFFLLDGDSTESHSVHATTTSTDCQRLSIDLSFGIYVGQVTDQSETDQFDDSKYESDGCTSFS